MRDGAQILEGMALLLQRIIRGAFAEDFEGSGVQLKGLLHLGGGNQRAGGGQRRADADAADQITIVFYVFLGQDDLQVLLDALMKIER